MSLFYIFQFFINIVLKEEISFAQDIKLLIIAFFIFEGAFTFEVEGTEVISRFFVSKGSEAILIISFNQNI